MSDPFLRPPCFSLVIPALNEAENIFPVFKEIAAISATFPPFEILAVDDGSRDLTLKNLKSVRRRYGLPMRIFHHRVSLGKSAALQTAISHARAPYIVTMDSDGQDNPVFILKLLAEAEKIAQKYPAFLIVGGRQKRCDSFSRRFATKAANALRHFFLQDSCFDAAAPMKIFPKDFFLSLPQFEGLHRFLPAFVKMKQGKMRMVPVTHRHRLYGASKYTNYGRALVGLCDLFGVFWLSLRYRHKENVSEEI